jgi:hypothetical protein
MKTSQSNSVFVSTLPSDDTLERQKLEERLTDVQRDARCVRRAVQLMLFLAALAIVGLGHTVVLIPEWPYTIRRFMMEWPIKAQCALGLASMACALFYFVLGLRYSKQLSWLRLECSRIANPNVIPLPLATGIEESDPFKDAA